MLPIDCWTVMLNSVISNDVTQVVNIPFWILEWDTECHALLDLNLDATICSRKAFLPLRNSGHVVLSFSMDFLSNSKGDAFFIAQLVTILVLIETVFVIIWEIIYGRISSNLVLLLLLLSFVSESRLVLMYMSLIVNIRLSITHFHGFSAACAAEIAHRSHIFCLNKQNKSSESKERSRQVSICYKRA